MAEDFGALLTNLRHIFPASQLEPVAEPALAAIRREYPGVPEHYLAFLREIGCGSLGGWFTVYSGPVEPTDIFGLGNAVELNGLVFFGDVVGSTLFGFDVREGWRLVGVDHHTLEIAPEEAATVAGLLASRLSG
jgi:hypothetical protein